ncbi:substrate-binding protein [Pseudoroseomonas deserti]|uniref:Substrate-binding protein n=2 Tax=Teichococcus deserti TaxID=1817963 RepID=A0A1V2H3P7_9PROT|nr:substrate-binding protein [Pseudoroseomonas deserti]
MRWRNWLALGALALGPLAFGIGAAPLRAEPLKVVLEAEIVTLDPHFTGAYITRTFGYMVFDTLFGPDSKGTMQPQMVDKYTTSEDGLTWNFTLRPGQSFHDGAPVTGADVVASLKRWFTRSALGGRLAAVTDRLEATGPGSFTLVLKERYGLVLDTLGTTSSPTPFIMPARIAATPGARQVSEIVGSGPFVYDRARHRTGDSLYLRRNEAYRPRPEPTDFLAGAKVVKVDGLDIRVIPDGATAYSALQAGDIDYMQYAPFDMLAAIERDRRLRLMNFTGAHRFTGHYRVNTASPPFNDPAIRRVLLRLVNQTEVMAGLGLDGRYSESCAAFFICGSPYETLQGAEALVDPSIEAAAAALKQTKYAGEPVIVLTASDLEAPKVSSQILADRLARAGFKVDLQVMDWASVLARRTQRQGWSVYGVHALGFDLASPLTNSVIAFNCTSSLTGGFICDQRLVPLYEAFARAPSREAQRDIAGQIQAIIYEQGLGIPFGQFAQPAAYRAVLEGLPNSAIPLFWNVTKK